MDNQLMLPPYTMFVDGAEGAFGVVFPDLPGIVAMDGSIEEALQNAAEALADAAEEAAAQGASLPAPRRVEDLSPPEDCILTTFIVLAERQTPPPGGGATSR